MARLDPQAICMFDSDFSFGGCFVFHSCMQPSEQYCLDLANESFFSLVNLEQLRQEIIPSWESW